MFTIDAVHVTFKTMKQDRPEVEGLRERKRKETLTRITDTALGMFAANGYEATTLDAIADAANIARRTFFYYFKSKEEIVLAWQNDVPAAVHAAVLAQSASSPLDAVGGALLELQAHIDPAQAIAIDRILRSTEHLRAANQAKFIRVEEAAFDALCQLWPDPEQRIALRIAAMVGVGALRLALDRWAEDDGRKPLESYLRQNLASIKAEF